MRPDISQQPTTSRTAASDWRESLMARTRAENQPTCGLALASRATVPTPAMRHDMGLQRDSEEGCGQVQNASTSAWLA